MINKYMDVNTDNRFNSSSGVTMNLLTEIYVTKETTRVADDVIMDMISTSRKNSEMHRNDFVISELSSSTYHVHILIGGEHENVL